MSAAPIAAPTMEPSLWTGPSSRADLPCTPCSASTRRILHEETIPTRRRSTRTNAGNPMSTVHEDHHDQHQRGLRILVVDDNHDAASSMSTLLELEGHRTGTAHDGLEAV